jgi:hypothetical protein
VRRADKLDNIEIDFRKKLVARYVLDLGGSGEARGPDCFERSYDVPNSINCAS